MNIKKTVTDIAQWSPVKTKKVESPKGTSTRARYFIAAGVAMFATYLFSAISALAMLMFVLALVFMALGVRED